MYLRHDSICSDSVLKTLVVDKFEEKKDLSMIRSWHLYLDLAIFESFNKIFVYF